MQYAEKEPVSLFLSELSPLEDRSSSLQSVQLLQHPWLGKVLIINEEIQHVESYQALYHEPLVHLPAAFLPEIESVLILGGGSLFAANEVLKYPSVKKVVLCDYDHNVIELMVDHYPHARRVIDDPRFIFVEQEGLSFVEQEKKSYDLIVNDCFNLAKESNLHGASYYQKLSRLSSDAGVCVDIIYRHIFDRQTTVDTLKYLQEEQNVALSMVVVPEYPGILHVETVWGKNQNISQKCRHSFNHYHQDILKGSVPSPFSFFSPGFLPYYLYLPPYIKNQFNL